MATDAKCLFTGGTRGMGFMTFGFAGGRVKLRHSL
jgi:hypothetical protein